MKVSRAQTVTTGSKNAVNSTGSSGDRKDLVKSFVVAAIVSAVSFHIVYTFLRKPAAVNISFASLFIISCWSCYVSIKKIVPDPYHGVNHLKWVFIISAIALFFFSIVFEIYSEFIIYLAFYCFVLSLISYFGGTRLVAAMVVPIGVLMLILPFFDVFFSFISFPMRLLSTKTTVLVLSFFGMDISSVGAVITVGARKVAITAACSGLVLLETLIWIAWLVVRKVHKSFFDKTAHYLMIIPVVILANTLRLTITVILFSIFGEGVLTSPVHIWLGSLMIVFASVMFYFAGYFFPKGADNA